MSFGSLPEIALLSYALALGCVFVAAIVQSTIGMGFGQVAAPLLLLIDIRFVPAAVIIMGMVTAILGAIRGRRQIAFGEISISLTGRMAGALLAGYVVSLLVDTKAFSFVFAGLIVLAVGFSLWRWNISPTPRALVVAGFLSGFMGTVTAVGAPPMGLVYQNRTGPEIRATLNGFFAFGTVASLIALWIYGLLGLDDFVLAGLLFPALIAGTAVSRFLTGFADRRMRPIILGLCILSALLVVWKALSI